MSLIKLEMGGGGEGGGMYKTQNGISPEESVNYLCMLATYMVAKRNQLKMVIYNCHKKLKSAQGSISYSGAKLWNSILSDIRQAEPIVSFKEKYKGHLALVQSI